MRACLRDRARGERITGGDRLGSVPESRQCCRCRWGSNARGANRRAIEWTSREPLGDPLPRDRGRSSRQRLASFVPPRIPVLSGHRRRRPLPPTLPSCRKPRVLMIIRVRHGELAKRLEQCNPIPNSRANPGVDERPGEGEGPFPSNQPWQISARGTAITPARARRGTAGSNERPATPAAAPPGTAMPSKATRSSRVGTRPATPSRAMRTLATGSTRRLAARATSAAARPGGAATLRKPRRLGPPPEAETLHLLAESRREHPTRAERAPAANLGERTTVRSKGGFGANG